MTNSPGLCVREPGLLRDVFLNVQARPRDCRREDYDREGFRMHITDEDDPSTTHTLRNISVIHEEELYNKDIYIGGDGSIIQKGSRVYLIREAYMGRYRPARGHLCTVESVDFADWPWMEDPSYGPIARVIDPEPPT